MSNKILTFTNTSGNTVTITPTGRLIAQTGDETVFSRDLDSFNRIYLNAALAVNGILKREYDKFCRISPVHVGHDCANCYQHYPIVQKDPISVEEDGIYIGIGFIGYCDRKTCVLLIGIYDVTKDESIYDATFPYSGMAYEEKKIEDQQAETRVNAVRSKIMEDFMNTFLSGE